MLRSGILYLVGASPGNPGLLTLGALRLTERGNVVVHDRLVSEEILALIPPGVARIAAGKAPGHYCVHQSQINKLLTSVACKSRRVVRSNPAPSRGNGVYWRPSRRSARRRRRLGYRGQSCS